MWSYRRGCPWSFKQDRGSRATMLKRRCWPRLLLVLGLQILQQPSRTVMRCTNLYSLYEPFWSTLGGLLRPGTWDCRTTMSTCRALRLQDLQAWLPFYFHHVALSRPPEMKFRWWSCRTMMPTDPTPRPWGLRLRSRAACEQQKITKVSRLSGPIVHQMPGRILRRCGRCGRVGRPESAQAAPGRDPAGAATILINLIILLYSLAPASPDSLQKSRLVTLRSAE